MPASLEDVELEEFKREWIGLTVYHSKKGTGKVIDADFLKRLTLMVTNSDGNGLTAVQVPYTEVTKVD